MEKIMVVEDDIYLREEIIHTMKKEGYSVSSISSFSCPEKEIMQEKPDLIILDLHLPGKSGFELCKILKSKMALPILILTACDTLNDELRALGLGADDFLTKPCHPKRLLARVQTLLKTYKKINNIVQAGELILDTDIYKATLGTNSINLAETEGKLLMALIEGYPSMVSQSELFQTVWGGSEYVDENILQVNITRLRKRLRDLSPDDIIKTVRGKGYYLEADHP